jgi:hypothetical protein
VASYFADVLNPSLLFGASGTGPVLHNTAANCIFIFMAGAPSQVDLWDLKEGAWTPYDFAPTSYGDVRWPQGLLPKTAAHLGKLSIVRCGMAWAAVHPLAQQWAQISRNPTGVNGAVAPHIGSVVALESQAARGPGDILPGFMAVNSGTIPGSGYLPARYAPWGLQPSPQGLTTLTHPDGPARFSQRWSLFHSLDANRQSGALGKLSNDMNDCFDQSKTLIDTPGINTLFQFNDTESARYGSTPFGDSLIVARNLVNARKGVRFVEVVLDGWDHHSSIYQRRAPDSLYSQCGQFDPAFAALLTDLSTMTGANPGKTLLDETLIVAVGEFGRTVGPLNGQSGRDHYLRNSIVFAGGGTRGGRTIGKTDSLGDGVLDYQWSGQRDVRPEDLASTIYSALGIDYTTVRTDDPAGLGFPYVPLAKDGVYRPVDELF